MVPAIQYATPRLSNFCYMTTSNGVVRYDLYPEGKEYAVTYYLYVNRFEGMDGLVNYHVTLDSDTEYTLSVTTSGGKESVFTRDNDGVYNLTLQRNELDGTPRPIWITAAGGDKVSTGLMVTGREYESDVYFDLKLGSRLLDVAAGEGIKS